MGSRQRCYGGNMGASSVLQTRVHENGFVCLINDYILAFSCFLDI